MKRKDFLHLGAATALWSLAPGCTSTPLPRRISPNESSTTPASAWAAWAATTSRTSSRIRAASVVALCDVDRAAAAGRAAQVPGARLYTDWRELLAQEGDRIDSVSVSVPDHMHAAIALPALRAAKHVYCQKPLCHDVAECRALTRAAQEAGVVSQLGTQHASGPGDRQAVQWLREGVIGKVTRVILCSNRPGAVERYRLVGPRPTEAQRPCPTSLGSLARHRARAAVRPEDLPSR
jgi:predicted dehydrogenase